MARRSDPTAKPKTRHPLKRRGEIIDVAARVFAERGYHGATTQYIADALGMRQASLYYYFDSKEAALEAVCMRGVEGFVERAEAILDSERSAADRLRRLIAGQIAPLGDRPDYVRTFLNERKWLSTASRRRVGKLSRRVEAIFEEVIRQGAQAGEFRRDLDPRLTTLALLGMANSVSSWLHRERASIDVIADAFAELALEGATAPDEPA